MALEMAVRRVPCYSMLLRSLKRQAMFGNSTWIQGYRSCYLAERRQTELIPIHLMTWLGSMWIFLDSAARMTFLQGSVRSQALNLISTSQKVIRAHKVLMLAVSDKHY